MHASTPQPPPARRRGRFARFAVEATAIVHAGAGDYPCAVRDLSRSGVRLAGPLPTSLDRVLDLTLRGVRSEPQLRLRARPARRTEGAQGRGAAFEFLDLGTDQRRGLERLVESGWTHPSSPEVALDALRPGAPVPEIRAALEAIPAPQRIAFAARAGRKGRELLRHDTLPAVLDALARNPRLSTAEACLLVGSPHLSTAALEALALDPRRERNDDWTVAILSSTRATPRVADALLARIEVVEARRLLRRPHLAPQARERLSRRVARGH